MEVTKVDAKGRITIPSYMRLAMGLEGGGRVFVVYDEERGVIEIRLVKPGTMFLCVADSVELQELDGIVREYGQRIHSLSCIRSGSDALKCRIVSETPIEFEGFMCKPVE